MPDILDQETVEEIAKELCEDGFHNDLLFQSRENRDAVYKAAKERGAVLRRSSTGHQLLDPRYTVEGRHIPDQGLNNDYRHSFSNLYVLDRTL